MLTVFGTLAYFFPTVVGWILTWRIPGLRLRRLFLINLLTGWTVIGWFASLVYLFFQLKAVSGGMGVGAAYAASPSSGTPQWQPGQERERCASCSGGQVTCSMCAGRGGTWIRPQTAEGSDRWDACAACVSSGKVTCMSCGGSGFR